MSEHNRDFVTNAKTHIIVITGFYVPEQLEKSIFIKAPHSM